MRTKDVFVAGLVVMAVAGFVVELRRATSLPAPPVDSTVAPASNSASTSTVVPRRYDLSAQSACEQFFDLSQDLGKGIVSDAERRARVAQMYQEARFADPIIAPMVARSAERLLAGVTTGTDSDVANAAKQLQDACNSYIRASR